MKKYSLIIYKIMSLLLFNDTHSCFKQNYMFMLKNTFLRQFVSMSIKIFVPNSMCKPPVCECGCISV